MVGLQLTKSDEKIPVVRLQNTINDPNTYSEITRTDKERSETA